MIKHLLSFLAFPAQKKTFLVHETSAQFLNLARPRGGKKLLEHETSAQFLSASFNIVWEERVVYICLSIYLPVPFSAFQPSLNSGIHSQIRGQDCALRVGGLSLPIEDSAHSLKLIRCPTQAKGSSWLLTNVCLLPQCGSTIVDTQ